MRRYALLAAAGLVVSGATALRDIQPNDEGLMLQAAARIAAGEVPFRDFWWFYPPGQPYLLGGLWALFGPSLLTWRIVRVLADAAVALLAYALARRLAGAARAASPATPHRGTRATWSPSGEAWGVVAWVAAICAMAYPSGPHPFPIALAAALGALLVAGRRPGLAGALTGICAAWRIEFALALGAGIVLAHPHRVRYAATALATSLVLFAPVVLAAGLRPSFDLLVDYPLTDFRRYQSLPFPLAYDGPWDASSPGALLHTTLEPALLHFLPLVLVVGFAAAAADVALRLRPGRAAAGWRAAAAAEPARLATLVFAAGCLAYLLVRADLFHTAPLAVLLAVLAPSVRRPALAAVALAALVYVAAEGIDRRTLVLRENTRRLELPVADGVRVPPAEAAALERVVDLVDGRSLYVMGRRSDRVTAGHPLLYVLAGARNPTRYDIAAPGVVTTARVQREIIDDLERARTAVVVRWTSPLTAAPEDNDAGRENGARLLDDHVRRFYRPRAGIGEFRLLVRR